MGESELDILRQIQQSLEQKRRAFEDQQAKKQTETQQQAVEQKKQEKEHLKEQRQKEREEQQRLAEENREKRKEERKELITELRRRFSTNLKNLLRIFTFIPTKIKQVKEQRRQEKLHKEKESLLVAIRNEIASLKSIGISVKKEERLLKKLESK